MDVLSLIGLLILLYYFVYIFCAFVLDSDVALAIKEKFGKPICEYRPSIFIPVCER